MTFPLALNETRLPLAGSATWETWPLNIMLSVRRTDWPPGGSTYNSQKPRRMLFESSSSAAGPRNNLPKGSLRQLLTCNLGPEYRPCTTRDIRQLRMVQGAPPPLKKLAHRSGGQTRSQPSM